MRILVTNDDGILAPGLGAVAQALCAAGHDVTVVAPLADHSGASAATVLRLRRPMGAVSFRAVRLPADHSVPAFGIAALPAVCVALALAGSFGPPADLVVAGINRGPNVGRFILHSGTVGAALTAAQLGRSALAIGLRVNWTAPAHYETAAAVAVALVEPLASMRTGTVLNCNVPDVGLDALRGVRCAGLNAANIFHVQHTGSRRVRLSPGFPDRPTAPDDDWALGTLGFATLTPITCPATDPDPAVQAAVAETAARLDARFARATISAVEAQATPRRRAGGVLARLGGVRRRLTRRVNW